MEIENYKIKKRKGGRFFFFLLTILCVGLSVVVSHFFASIITTSTGGTPVAGGNSSNYTLYAISLGGYSSKSQAEDNAITARKQNAGGYIFKQDITYHVLASIYEKKNDAESVLKNLTTSFEPQIVEIKIDKVDLPKISSGNLKKSYINMMMANGLRSSVLNL